MKPSILSGVGGQQRRVEESQMQKFMAKPWLGNGSWLQLSGDWVLPTLKCHFFVSARRMWYSRCQPSCCLCDFLFLQVVSVPLGTSDDCFVFF